MDQPPKRTQEEIDNEKAELAKTIKEATEAVNKLSVMKEKAQGSEVKIAEEQKPKIKKDNKSEEEKLGKDNEIKGIAEILGSEKAINYYKDKDQKEIEKTKEEKQKLESFYQQIKKDAMNLGSREFFEYFKLSKSLDDINILINQALEKDKNEPGSAFAKKKLELLKLKEEIRIQKAPEEINKKIAEEEAKNGVPFTPEQKKALTLEMFLNEKENSQAEKIESSGKFKKALSGTAEWWKKLDNTKKGKALKAGMGALFIASTTIVAGSALGIAPTSAGQIVYRLGSRVAMATGLNMAITSNLSKNILGSFLTQNKKEKTGWKKYMGWGDVVSILGLGGSALLTGGLSVPLIGAVGYASRKITNAVFDNKIERLEKENNSNEENADKIKKLKMWKSIINGAETIGVGLGTMEVLHHQAEVKAEEVAQVKGTGKNISEEVKSPSGSKSQEEVKQAELRQQQELKAKIEEQIRTKDATVGNREGIEHAFIRQIQNNPDLAKSLGYKTDMNLKEFAEHQAHVIAIKEGYVDNAGHEIRIAEAGKVAYEVKMENGHVIVEEKTVGGETLETHHEGDKFEEKVDKYEHIYTKPHEISESAEIKHIDTHIRDEETFRKFFESKNGEPKTEYVDTSKPQMTPFENKETPMTPFEHKEVPMTPFTHTGGHVYTETEWAKAPENIYHIPLKDFIQVNELHTNNIDHIIHGQHLSDTDTKNVGEMVKEGDANTMMEMDEVDVKGGIHYPLWQYEHKLNAITEWQIKPMGETPLHPAELNKNYIYRLEMKAASMGRLDEIKLGK